MSRKRKYSDELRLSIVKEYLEGKNGGFDVLGRKYGIHRSDIQNWVRRYTEGGIEALFATSGTYSGAFKIHAVEYMHQHSMSIVKAAAHFHIPSHSTLAKWERIYYEDGKEALMEERRGRSKKMSTQKNNQQAKKDVNQNEDLLAEVQRLRMENEFLKKLIALTQEEEKAEQKK